MGTAAYSIHGYFGGNSIARDFSHLIIGKRLGGGVSRDVYGMPPDNKFVLKFETGEGWFQNVAEWHIWQSVQHSPKYAKWFAPCIEISPCGLVLVQKRTTPVIGDLPTHMPAFFTDFKPANYGRIGKNVVAVDYGRNLLSQTGLTKRMRKADWS